MPRCLQAQAKLPGAPPVTVTVRTTPTFRVSQWPYPSPRTFGLGGERFRVLAAGVYFKRGITKSRS